MNRTCTICGRSDVEFYKNSGNHCKACCIRQTNEYRKAHPDVQRKTRQNASRKPGYKQRKAEYMRKFRANNPDYVKRSQESHQGYNQLHRKELLAKQLARQASNKALVNTYKEKPCMDCGQRFPPFVMDFDHVRGEKIKSVAEMCNNRPVAAILAEIEKCDLVCANCHRIRTQSRYQPIVR